jgi:ZIP family zinc transporter
MVDGYLLALLLAALPALGNFGGGLVAEVTNVSERVLSLALHAALGILLAVIGLELMPEALRVGQPWVPVLAFVVGGAFFLVADQAIHTVEARFGGRGEAGPWLVFFAVSVDLFSDGLMIGTGALIGSTLALLLALGQVSADIPEGFATVAGFKRQGLPRSKRLLVAAAFVLPIFAGTTIGGVDPV